jgi:uncharacterized protein (TIGR02757 family)
MTGGASKRMNGKGGRAASDASRQKRIGRALEQVRARCDVAARRDADPVGVVPRVPDPRDKEIVALLAASIAFGNVKTIRAKLDDALRRLGPRPALAADDQLGMFARMDGWIHRVFRGEDVARLVIGARRLQRAHGSLGRLFEGELAEKKDLRGALAGFCDAVRGAGGLPLPRAKKGESTPLAASGARARRRGPYHILPDPLGGGGSKRLLLFLRWMIRPADGIDLGLWDISPAVLLVPVDTHIHKLAKNLGFTKRNQVNWETAEEITRALARFDPKDPVKHDFSLCHLGMLQRCPSRKDPKRCEGCGVKPVCRHWG